MSLKLQFTPQPDQVVQSIEIPVLVVPLDPLVVVRDGHALREGDGLPEVYHVDGGEAGAVVHEQQGTTNQL